jgi:preprotein translocase SecE subunit
VSAWSAGSASTAKRYERKQNAQAKRKGDVAEEESLPERVGQFAREVRAEARKVVWPDLRRTGLLTAAVIFTVLVLGVLVYLADLLFGAILH